MKRGDGATFARTALGASRAAFGLAPAWPASRGVCAGSGYFGHAIWRYARAALRWIRSRWRLACAQIRTRRTFVLAGLSTAQARGTANPVDGTPRELAR